MKTQYTPLKFTDKEIESLRQVANEWTWWPGCAALRSINLEAVADTGGMHQEDKDRDLLANALHATLERDWPRVPKALVSAALKVWAGPYPVLMVTHPPTGRVLEPWLLDGAVDRVETGE